MSTPVQTPHLSVEILGLQYTPQSRPLPKVPDPHKTNEARAGSKGWWSKMTSETAWRSLVADSERDYLLEQQTKPTSSPSTRRSQEELHALFEKQQQKRQNVRNAEVSCDNQMQAQGSSWSLHPYDPEIQHSAGPSTHQGQKKLSLEQDHHVEIKVVFNLDMTTAGISGSTERKKFQALLAQDLSQAACYPYDCFEIQSVHALGLDGHNMAANVRISTDPLTNSGELYIQQVALGLRCQAERPQSPLLQGEITCRCVKIHILDKDEASSNEVRKHSNEDEIKARLKEIANRKYNLPNKLQQLKEQVQILRLASSPGTCPMVRRTAPSEISSRAQAATGQDVDARLRHSGFDPSGTFCKTFIPAHVSDVPRARPQEASLSELEDSNPSASGSRSRQEMCKDSLTSPGFDSPTKSLRAPSLVLMSDRNGLSMDGREECLEISDQETLKELSYFSDHPYEDSIYYTLCKKCDEEEDANTLLGHTFAETEKKYAGPITYPLAVVDEVANSGEVQSSGPLSRSPIMLDPLKAISERGQSSAMGSSGSSCLPEAKEAYTLSDSSDGSTSSYISSRPVFADAVHTTSSACMTGLGKDSSYTFDRPPPLWGTDLKPDEISKAISFAHRMCQEQAHGEVKKSESKETISLESQKVWKTVAQHVAIEQDVEVTKCSCFGAHFLVVKPVEKYRNKTKL